MLYLIAFLNVAVVVVVLVGIGYLKRLPQRLHEEGLKRLEHGLRRELEALKDALVRDRELLRIVRSDLQARKTDELVRLGEFFTDIFADPDKIKRRVRLNTAITADATYVQAAAFSTFRAAGISSAVRYPPSDKIRIALLLALNSTGNVKMPNSTANEKNTTPNSTKIPYPIKSPIKNIGIPSIEPKFATGTKFVRRESGKYP